MTFFPHAKPWSTWQFLRKDSLQLLTQLTWLLVETMQWVMQHQVTHPPKTHDVGPWRFFNVDIFSLSWGVFSGLQPWEVCRLQSVNLDNPKNPKVQRVETLRVLFNSKPKKMAQTGRHFGSFWKIGGGYVSTICITYTYIIYQVYCLVGG